MVKNSWWQLARLHIMLTGNMCYMATTDSKGSIIAKDLAVIIVILLPSPGPCCRVGPGSGPVHAATDGNSHQCHYSASDCSICNDNTSENVNK